MLGIAQSVGSIARIPSPLVGGIVAEIAGLDLAFYQRNRSNILLFP
jgi:hypothetical protein